MDDLLLMPTFGSLGTVYDFGVRLTSAIHCVGKSSGVASFLLYIFSGRCTQDCTHTTCQNKKVPDNSTPSWQPSVQNNPLLDMTRPFMPFDCNSNEYITWICVTTS